MYTHETRKQREKERMMRWAITFVTLCVAAMFFFGVLAMT
jgi:hypothetical protein